MSVTQSISQSISESVANQAVSPSVSFIVIQSFNNSFIQSTSLLSLSVHLSVYLSAYLSVHLSICLSNGTFIDLCTVLVAVCFVPKSVVISILTAGEVVVVVAIDLLRPLLFCRYCCCLRFTISRAVLAEIVNARRSQSFQMQQLLRQL